MGQSRRPLAPSTCCWWDPPTSQSSSVAPGKGPLALGGAGSPGARGLALAGRVREGLACTLLASSIHILFGFAGFVLCCESGDDGGGGAE